MSRRSDVHRPAALVAIDYEYVAPEYLKIEGLGDALYLQQCRETVRKHMAATGGEWSSHAHGGNCMVCGNAQAVYTIVFHHPATNTYIRMGQNCAEQVDSLRYSRNDVACMRRAVSDARQRKAGIAKAQAVLADAGLEQVWGMVQDLAEARRQAQIAFERDGDTAPRFEPAPALLTMADIVGKLVKYGSISTAQTNYLRKLVDQAANWTKVQEQREVEREQAQPAPTGRVVVEGELISIKGYPGYAYGSIVTRMTVKTDAGWLAWGTMPIGLDARRGDRVRFTATVQPSDRDPKFGIFKRPASAMVTAKADEAA